MDIGYWPRGFLALEMILCTGWWIVEPTDFHVYCIRYKNNKFYRSLLIFLVYVSTLYYINPGFTIKETHKNDQEPVFCRNGGFCLAVRPTWLEWLAARRSHHLAQQKAQLRIGKMEEIHHQIRFSESLPFLLGYLARVSYPNEDGVIAAIAKNQEKVSQQPSPPELGFISKKMVSPVIVKTAITSRD